MDYLRKKHRIANEYFQNEFRLYKGENITSKESQYTILMFFEYKALRRKYKEFWELFCRKYGGTDNRKIQKLVLKIGM